MTADAVAEPLMVAMRGIAAGGVDGEEMMPNDDVSSGEDEADIAALLEDRETSHNSASGAESEEERHEAQDEEKSAAVLVDNKAASFARAFAKIMATSGAQKGILSVRPQLTIEHVSLIRPMPM
jgi:hypothetical protein